MLFINTTETIGQIISNGTVNLTGTISATLFFILIILVVLCMMFGIPLEFLSIIILPFVIAVGAFYNTFMIPLIVILLYVAMIVAKNWLFR